MGPLVCADQLDLVHTHVEKAIVEGGTVLTGGKPAEDKPEGYFYPATVIADCRQDMAIVRDEIFGPVMPIVTVDDLDEAISLANDSEFGLTSSIYTKNLDVAMRACKELKVGETYVNRENDEAIQGFHAGWRKSGLGGAGRKARSLREYSDPHGLCQVQDLIPQGLLAGRRSSSFGEKTRVSRLS